VTGSGHAGRSREERRGSSAWYRRPAAISLADRPRAAALR